MQRHWDNEPVPLSFFFEKSYNFRGDMLGEDECIIIGRICWWHVLILHFISLIDFVYVSVCLMIGFFARSFGIGARGKDFSLWGRGSFDEDDLYEGANFYFGSYVSCC